jgi:amino acid adenylation domain-containing protein
MGHTSKQFANLPPEQEAIRAKCFHPTGMFVEFPKEDLEISIPERFEKIVREYPDRIAVQTGEQVLTYDALNKAANRIAWTVHRQTGGMRETIVLLSEDSANSIIACLGILKAGKILVVVDTSLPKDRMTFIFDDSHAQAIVTDRHMLGMAEASARSAQQVINIDALPIDLHENDLRLNIPSDATAQIVYSSGSTGQPKGIFFNHQRFLHDVRDEVNACHLCPDDRIIYARKLTFGAGVRVLFLALLSGASIFPYDIKKDGLQKMPAFLIRERITIFRPGASIYRYFVNQLSGIERFPHIRMIVMSGVALSPVDIEAFKRIFAHNCLFLYHLSSSEAGLMSLIFFSKETKLRDAVIPVGYSVEDKKILLFDEKGREVDPGQVGEIAIQSRYLSSGYWHNIELTSARFLSDPAGGEERIHLTGDWGRMTSDGLLTHVGRKDFMVKIREYRVEIGEIEKALLLHPQVVNAGVAVWDRESGEKYLAAYVVPRQVPAPTINSLSEFLRELIPDHMIPSAFVFIEALPLTNGKLDRKALPRPDDKRPELTQFYVAPRSEVERKLAQIWAEVLSLDRVGIHDNFFDLGGHSLQAMRIASRVTRDFQVDLPPNLLLQNATIVTQADYIEVIGKGPTQDVAHSILRVSRHGQLPLSFAQEGLWFLDQLEPQSSTYNESSAVRLGGSLDVKALEKALNQIVARHEVLRTTIEPVNGTPFQVIANSRVLQLPVVDLWSQTDKDHEAEAHRLIGETIRKPFDLSRDVMLRVLLLRLTEQMHILLIVKHHIASDGWSSRILWQELSALYRAFTSGQANSLPDLPIQYVDYAIWQRGWLQGEVLESQISYWKKQLEGVPAVVNLPADRARPAVQTFRGARQSVDLSKELTQGLKTLSHEQGVTLFMTLLGAFQTLLYRYTGQDDIVVGTAIAGRNRTEIEGVIGFFVNTLVLRTDCSGHPTFCELLARVRKVALGAYAHQDLPFEKLVEELRPARNLSRTPLFQVFFNMFNERDFKPQFTGLTTEWCSAFETESKFDLTVYVREQNDKIHINLVYNADLFSEAWMTCFSQQYRYLLEQVVAKPQQSIRLYSLVAPESRILLTDPSVVLAEPSQQPVTSIFLSWAKQMPKHPAIRQGEHTWTYGDLAKRADTIARVLRARGLERGDVIAVCGPQSFGLIASMLGTLLSGGVLLPIDHTLPDQRKQVVLKEAGAKKLIYVGDKSSDGTRLEGDFALGFLFVDPATGCAVAGASNLDPESILLPELSSDDPAYIFFTSGTTGTPKGVLGCHKGLSHFLKWQRETFDIGPDDRVAQLMSLSFDASFRDIFLPLTSGATLCLPEGSSTLASSAIVPWLQRERVSVLHAVPSLAQSWLANVPAHVTLPSMRWVFFIGEPLTDALVRQWRDAFPNEAEIVNFYGPTETTLVKCFYRLSDDLRPGVQAIGQPIPDSQALILGENNQLCGINEPGEIVLRTPFRSLGYINAPQENQKRFVKNPFREDDQDLLYFTGDAGRYAPDGTLEILGRLDDQIKIRGVRVEPAEVTAILAGHPAITSCAVVARKDEKDEMYLIAYAVAAEQAKVTTTDLRTYLFEQVPAAMVPSAFVFLDALPLSANGKIDRNALPVVDRRWPDLEPGYVAPRTEVESSLAEIWAEVLKLDQVGIHDDFFDLGGHSLLATQAISRINKALQVELPLRVLFEKPTLVGLSDHIEVIRSKAKKYQAPSAENADGTEEIIL